MATHLSDEDLLVGHLMDLRCEAMLYEQEALLQKNPDTKALQEQIVENLRDKARALHRLLEKNGVRGLGPIAY